MKWFDDKYLVTAVATIIFLLLIITLVIIVPYVIWANREVD